MKYQNLLFGALSLLLASGSGHAIQTVPIGKSTVEVDDKPVVCSGLSEETNRMKKRRPLDTGVLREAPIDVIPKELFMERLEASPLWDKVNHLNSLKNSFSLKELNGFLTIMGDSIGQRSERLNKISYSPLDVDKRNEFGHQLLDQEKFAMIEIINIVIEDRGKATEILEQLYQQYLVKVENNEVLSDGMTLHTYIRYRGMLFELWGTNQGCKLNLLTGISIQ